MVAMVGMGAQFLAQEPHHGVEPLQSREPFYDHNVVAMTMAHMRLFVDKDGSLPHPRPIREKSSYIIRCHFAVLKCKEKVQKKVFLKDDHLAQEPAQTDCFVQEFRFIILHKWPLLCRK